MITIKVVGDMLEVSCDVGSIEVKKDGTNFSETQLLDFLYKLTDKKREVVLTKSADPDDNYRMKLIELILNNFLDGYFNEKSEKEDVPVK